jgi:septation ring formation regulator EzrA
MKTNYPKVKKMTEEQVKALIQELRDEMPDIFKKLNEGANKDKEEGYQSYLKEEKKKDNK